MPATSDRAVYIDAVIRNLEQTNPLREPALRSVITALNLAPDSQGLDIGCGIGQPAVLLAEATSPGGVSQAWTFLRNCSPMPGAKSKPHRWQSRSLSRKVTCGVCHFQITHLTGPGVATVWVIRPAICSRR